MPWRANAEYTINRRTWIFARLEYGNYQEFNTATNRELNLEPLVRL